MANDSHLTGVIGAEFKSSGSFIAFGVGLTSDGNSASEDMGIPSF